MLIWYLTTVLQICAPTPYDHINDANDAVCAKGLRKPVYNLGLDSSKLSDLEKVWEQWVEWSAREGAGMSVVLTECYGLEKAREVRMRRRLTHGGAWGLLCEFSFFLSSFLSLSFPLHFLKELV